MLAIFLRFVFVWVGGDLFTWSGRGLCFLVGLHLVIELCLRDLLFAVWFRWIDACTAFRCCGLRCGLCRFDVNCFWFGFTRFLWT